MPDEKITTELNIDIKQLKKNIQEAKLHIRSAASEFEEAASKTDDWTKSTDGITAKLTQLTTKLKNQKTILESLKKQYAAVAAEQGENSAAAEDLKIDINYAQAAVNKIEREMSQYEETLKEVSEAEKKAAKTGKDVSEVLDDMGNETENTGDGFTTLKGTIATFAGNMLTSLVGGIKNGISSIMSLAEETREYRSELAKLDTAFTTAGHSTKAAEQTYKDLYAVLGDEGQSVEAANHLAKLCNTEKELSDWTKIATGVYATFGASLPIEGLTEAANETAKVGKVTGPLADALNWAGVSEDKFNESLEKCSNEQERQQLITETLNGLYTEAANKYEETNKSVMDANRANSDYTDTLATMGQKIEPVTTTLKKGFNGLLQEMLKLVEDVDMGAFTAKIEDAFRVLIDEVLPALKDGFKWVIDNKGMVIGTVAGIAGAFAALKIVNLISDFQKMISIIKGWELITKAQTAAQWLLNLAMSANPAQLIITAIVALISVFVLLWNNCEGFRNFWINMWEKIKEVVGVAKDFIAEKIDSIKKFFTETLPNAFNAVIEWIKNNWPSLLLMLINPFAGLFKYFYDNNIKFKEFVDTAVAYIRELPAKVWTWLVDVVNKITIWGNDLANKGREAIQRLLTAVVDKASEIPGRLVSIGKDIVTGLWDGITSKVSWLKSKISGFVGDVTGWFKNFFKIGSPSKLMVDEVGKWLPEGIAVGIDKNSKSVLNAMKGLSVDTLGVARNGLSNASIGGTTGGGVVNNFTQVIHSPKQLSRLDIYRQSKNLLGYARG